MDQRVKCHAIIKAIVEHPNLKVTHIAEETGIHFQQLYHYYKNGAPVRPTAQKRVIELLLPYLFREPEKILFILLDHFPVYIYDEIPHKELINPIIRNLPPWFIDAVQVSYGHNMNQPINEERCLILIKSVNQVWFNL